MSMTQTQPAATGPTDPSPLDQLLREVLTRRREFVDSLTTFTGDEIADLAADTRTREMLSNSISENTVLLIQTLYEGEDPAAVEAPNGALTYARKLAQDEVSMASLMRAYRFGQARFTAMCLEVMQELELDVELSDVSELIAKIASFIDRISDIVSLEYEQERDRWARSRSGARLHWVNEVLAGDVTDVAKIERVLGYPLLGPHMAAELWSGGGADGSESLNALDRVVSYLAKYFGSPAPHVVVNTNENEARAWFAATRTRPVSAEEIGAWLKEQNLNIRIAIGALDNGIEGFRRSADQAARTKALAVNDPTRTVVSFWDVAGIAMLRSDPVEQWRFVRRVLGELADSDERNRGLRETLRVYLEHGGDHVRAAQDLYVHRNTVRYRVDQALRAIDPESTDLKNRQDVLLALSILQWHTTTEP